MSRHARSTLDEFVHDAKVARSRAFERVVIYRGARTASVINILFRLYASAVDKRVFRSSGYTRRGVRNYFH